MLACLPAWAADLADPTRPPPRLGAQAVDAPAAPPLSVNGVFLMGQRPYAVVDGVTVRIGDPLGGGRVGRIDEQGVWLDGRAGRRLLRLVPGMDKRPASPGKASMENRK